MTSSCLEPGLALGPRRGALPDGHGHGHPGHPWASENTVLLDNAIFWTTWHWAPRSGCVARLESSIFAQKTAIFGVETSIILGFLGIF